MNVIFNFLTFFKNGARKERKETASGLETMLCVPEY